MNRQQFLKNLESAHAPYVALGHTNRAILAHIEKVKMMSEEEFIEHKRRLDSLSERATRAARMMIREQGPIRFVGR